MYERFGVTVDRAKSTATFRLFFPDGERVPTEYSGGSLPRIKRVSVVGSFQIPQTLQWDLAHPCVMQCDDCFDPPAKGANAAGPLKGTLFQFTTAPLGEGFYEYKYLLEFENAPSRYLTDPCGRYGGINFQNSGFVVGGTPLGAVDPLSVERRPYQDLVIYELMIDDFTAQITQPNQAPLQAIIDKIPYLADLGINAIEFMPWTAWIAEDTFSWGYNPAQYFAVADKYTYNPAAPTNKLIYLQQLISACHQHGIQVIMDGVFNHADATYPDRGFPYYWLYEEPADSPYVGNFAQAAFFRDLDYANLCTLEYIRDACIYWIETFNIDGIRFDNTLGMYRPGDRSCGIPKLLSELRGYLSKTKRDNFALILEHSWDYSAIDVTNKIGATSCWLDQYRSLSMSFLGDRPQGHPQIASSIMRMLDAGRDFDPSRAPTIYIENHDHKRFILKAGGRDQWSLTQPYIMALFTSPGATLIYNGQEFGQSNDMPEQDETGNPRVTPRPVDWALKANAPGPDILARYTQMITIRNAHAGLRGSNFYPSHWDESLTKRDINGFGVDCTQNVVVYHRWGEADDGRTEKFYIVLNFSQQTQEIAFTVPDNGSWTDLISGNNASVTNGWLHAQVGSNWGAIYYKKYDL